MPHLATISVVDDDNSVRESLHGLLRSHGFTVTVFPSAEAFLKSADLPCIDCLFLDVQMGGMNGLQLQRQLRTQSTNLPIIFISAREDNLTRKEALDGGAIAYLVKPLREPAIMGALKTALEQS